MYDHKETIVHPELHHINLKTTRLQKMVDWYGKVVGTEVVFQFPGGAWLTTRGCTTVPSSTARSTTCYLLTRASKGRG